MNKRRAEVIVFNTTTTQSIEAYLPHNYGVVSREPESDEFNTGRDRITIEGVDDQGWTLDGYVLPRLASGLYFGKEVADADGETV